MPIEIVVALGAAVAVGGADMMSRLNARLVSPLFMTAFVSVAGAVLLFIANNGALHVATPQLMLLLGAGVLNTLGLLALYTGMARGVVGIVSPVASCSPVLVALMWMLVGVVPSIGAQIGLVITCLSLILLGVLSHKKTEPASRTAINFALLMGGLTALSLSVRMFIIQHTLDVVSTIDALIVVRISGSITALVLLWLLHKKAPTIAAIRPGSYSPKTIGWLLLQAVPETVGVLGVFWASRDVFRTIAPALFSCSTLITMLLARILIGEKMPVSARFAALGVIIGAACMSIFST